MVIILHFIVFSILGWIGAFLFSSAYAGKWKNESFFKFPFAPVYGFGALLLFFMQDFMSGVGSLFWSFWIYATVLTFFEFGSSIFCRKILKRKIWNYENNFMNLGGHVDLYHFVLWGLLGLLYLVNFETFIRPF